LSSSGAGVAAKAGRLTRLATTASEHNIFMGRRSLAGKPPCLRVKGEQEAACTLIR
jgi:hypothetical protein